jgi:hypothetical protein
MTNLVTCDDLCFRRTVYDQCMTWGGMVNSSVSHSFRLVYMPRCQLPHPR